MKKNILFMVTGLAGFMLIGCGGGSDSGSSSPTETNIPTVPTIALIDSGITSGYDNKPYDMKSSRGYYYDTIGCRINGLTTANFAIYSNGSATTSFSMYGNNYTSSCYVKGVYQKVDLNNTTDVNATFVNYNTFYDGNTKIYYDHNGYSGTNYKIVQITNDGMNAIVDQGNGTTTTVQILDSYRKIDLNSTGIKPYSLKAPLYTGTASDIVETAFVDYIGGKPYSIKGYLYNYSDSGCSINASTGSTYNIYNDGKIATSDDRGTVSTCSIVTLYQKVDLNNTTDVNATFVNYNTFYDGNTKIYYDHNGYSGTNYKIVQITNDGMNAIVDQGNGTTTTVQILDSYRKIN